MSAGARGTPTGIGRPVPTLTAVALMALGLLPAVLAILSPAFGWAALAIDLLVLLLCAVDYAFAPNRAALRVQRQVEDVLSSGVSNTVELWLEPTSTRALRGELRDEVPPGIGVDGHRQRFRLAGAEVRSTVRYRVTPPTRGDLTFGDAWVRLEGPLRLCARQFRVPLTQRVKVYPDLTALSREALSLTAAQDAPSERSQRRPADGTEFESLREYRTGDDFRSIDWKATARRSRTIVRVHQPERNQPVLLFLDCGRHMAGVVDGRRKLDHAVDAALRLAKVSLDQGDQVGVVAFAREVRTWLPPRKGAEHLRAIASVLYGVEAALEESDYGRALDLAFARHHRRTLVVLLTDLQDPATSATLLARTLALRPRHLPLIVSLLDEDVQRAANDTPADVHAAYVRQTAARLEEDYRRTYTRLRNAGALAIRAAPRGFGAAAVNEYLRVKARGML